MGMGQSDQVAKLLCKTILSPWAQVGTEEEISLSPQKIDVLVTIVPSKPMTEETIESIGLLARILAQETILEPYSSAMGNEDIDDVQRKQLAFQHLQEKQLEQSLGKRRRLNRPRSWIVSPLDSPLVRQSNGLVVSVRFGQGVYEMPEQQAVGVIVLSQLPKTRDTLALRLLDAGERLMDAIEEVLKLDVDDPLLKHLLFVLCETRLIEVDPMSQPSRLTPEVLAKIDEAIALRDELLRQEAVRELALDAEKKLAQERAAKERAVERSSQVERDLAFAQREREEALQRVAELEAKLAAMQSDSSINKGPTSGGQAE